MLLGKENTQVKLITCKSHGIGSDESSLRSGQEVDLSRNKTNKNKLKSLIAKDNNHEISDVKIKISIHL